MRVFGGWVGSRIIIVLAEGVKPEAGRDKAPAPVDRHGSLKQNDPAMPKQHWLLKTEPSEFSFDDLLSRGRETWDGITNPLALKHLRAARAGDLAIIYHTGTERRAVGLARVASDPYPDPHAGTASRSVVDLEPLKRLAAPVTLEAIKKDARFAGIDLLRIPRLSVVPLSSRHWEILMKMSGTSL